MHIDASSTKQVGTMSFNETIMPV